MSHAWPEFEPLAPDVSYTIRDGEALVNGTVQAHMLPGGVQFFCGLESVSEVAASAEVNMTTRGMDDRGSERLSGHSFSSTISLLV